MEWLTQAIITLTPLALVVLLLAAMAIGWIVYGFRGYGHWFRRFHRYRAIPTRRQMRRGYGYVEYVPEVINQPVMQPQARPPQIITKPKPVITTPVVEAPVSYSTKDDLQVIEGIGPKVEEVLNQNGIYTWHELSQTPIDNIDVMLKRAGLTLQDPTTWAKQAYMAYTGYWDELKAYQDILHGGK